VNNQKNIIEHLMDIIRTLQNTPRVDMNTMKIKSQYHYRKIYNTTHNISLLLRETPKNTIWNVS
jgi:hypothetical protein